jgi:hypothetical protein
MKSKTFGASSLLAALLATLCACSSGRRTGESRTGGEFEFLRVTPPPNSTLFLNDPLQFDFSSDVDPASADLNSVTIDVFDLLGNPLPERAKGTFRVVASAGDDAPGRRLEFVPLLPTNDAYDDGGFRPGRRYVVQLVGGDRRTGTVLVSKTGRPLNNPTSFAYVTVEGTTPAQLFRNTRPGGPRRAGFEVRPASLKPPNHPVYVTGLNESSYRTTEIELRFDQALNPSSANVPFNVDLDAVTRSAARRGRIYLTYADPAPNGEDTWIPADVEFHNSAEGATVTLRPIGALPNNAAIEVRVLKSLEDLAGESNEADVSYDPVFAWFLTEGSYAPQFDAMVERFDAASQVDEGAAFVEPIAEVGNGFVRANFAFEGRPTNVDFVPADTTTILNTDFAQVRLADGRTVSVTGGVFEFANVRIPAGYEVIGEGSRPMVWLVTGNMEIDGTLAMNGKNGETERGRGGADIPTMGGPGVGTGGGGGRGSPSNTGRSTSGEVGFGPRQQQGGGGGGGQHSCVIRDRICRTGAAGGGGSFASQGDPDFYTLMFPANNPFPVIVRSGDGYDGCFQAQHAGGSGDAGPVGFVDASGVNNFYGRAIRIDAPRNRLIRIDGELTAPRGGSGGGGGGDGAVDGCLDPASWRNDDKGGGGGGGAGVIIIKCLGRVMIKSLGKITAVGGHGGGGAGNSAGSSEIGGGGGGGSGGMIVVMASQIDIVKHGQRYAQLDGAGGNRRAGASDFALQADGGVGTRSDLPGKYPPDFPDSRNPAIAATWNNPAIGQKPNGGFGGDGLIQLMVPIGDNRDGTNTALDDYIEFYDDDAALAAGRPVNKVDKQAYLGWRGWLAEGNVFVDDQSQPVVLGLESDAAQARLYGLGDIKPSPVLMPAEFGHLSRARSEWIDLGRIDRRAVSDGRPRGISEVRSGNPNDPFTNLLAGPTYLFTGLSSGATSGYQGYVQYEQVSGGVEVRFPTVLPADAAIAQIQSDASFDGKPVYRVVLAADSAVLGAIPDRYSWYMAQLKDGNALVGEYRIVSHGARELFLDPRSGPLPARATGLQVAAKFFRLFTSGSEGLGPTAVRNGRNVPLANVKIGFRFHTNPGSAVAPSWPPGGGFAYDLDLLRPERMRELRAMQCRFVQYDILFNTRFSEERSEGNVDPNRSLTSTTPRPEVRELVLPFQF